MDEDVVVYALRGDDWVARSFHSLHSHLMLEYHRENTINQEEITSWAGGVALKLSAAEAPEVHGFRASE